MTARIDAAKIIANDAMKISMPNRPADSRADGSSNGETMLAMTLEDSGTLK
jgi:hypothetical protein